jgi:hypothetical protein
MGRLFFLALALSAMATSASGAGERHASRQWGFSVEFPDRLPTCANGSWRQQHGWGAPLAGTCRKPKGKRAITVIADGSELTKPEKATGCALREVEAGAKFGLSFDGRKSATCREDRDEDGTILITVVTQVDAEDHGHSRLGNAAIEYRAGLTTTPAMLMQDLVTFRRMLGSVQIDRPQPSIFR